MADELQSVWSQVRNFFAPQKDAIRVIEKQRFPGYYPQSFVYASRGKYYDLYQQYSQITHDLHMRYTDYEDMDDYPEISCLSGESLVFTLRDGWVRIDDLARASGDFWVLAYDRESGSLVPARATNARCTGKRGHSKQMVEVILDDGRLIRCTADHMFMRKGGKWVQAVDLRLGDRLMPGTVRIRPINTQDSGCYWQVHQPNSDSMLRSTDGKRWMWVHRLVAKFCHDREFGSGSVVHHMDENPFNNDPLNLSGVLKTKEHKRRIGESQPHKVRLDEQEVDAAWQKRGSVNGVAKELGVSWRVARRHLMQFDLMDDGGNHRVMGVRLIDSNEPVYDIEVPGYHNFVCNGVVVHNSALDMYADDATQPQIWKGKKRIWVEGDNENVVDDLNFVLHKQLNVNDFMWELTRYLCKYGNNYERMFVNENGVVATEPLPAALARRVHDQYGMLIGFLLSRTGDFNISPIQFRSMVAKNKGEGRHRTYYSFIHSTDVFAFEDWEVAHFRIVGKDRISEYGYSINEPARWVFRRLIMMEDSALIHKLTRAPSRYVFYVDTGNLPPRQALQHVQKVRDWYQRKRIVNPKNGKLDMSYNPLSMDEDIYIPTHRERGESVRVDTLMGPGYQPMDDVDYFRKKLGRAIKIPNFGRDDDVQARPLSQDDIRFASAVMRVQQAVREGFRKILAVHLVATGRSPTDTDWSVHMPLPSAILELARMEVLSAKSDVMSRMQENISVRWMLVELFGFSEEEAVNLMVMRQEELDLVAVAQFEREMLQQQAQAQEESTSPNSDTALLEAQKRIWSKVRHGGLGVSPMSYTKGRSDIDPEQFMRTLEKRDRELYDRLDMLQQGMRVIQSRSSL